VPTHGRPAANRKAVTVYLAADNQGGSNYTLFIMMGLIFAAMYFLMIRPQQRRRREMEAMQSSIGPGDEIVTIGGLYGTVVAIDDEAVTLEVAPGVTNRYARGSISRVVSRTESADEETESTADEVAERD
jgi:preprotein translocase subunit YajC